MRKIRWFLTLVVALAAYGWANNTSAAEKKSARELVSFSTLQASGADAVRAQALDWLKKAGHSDASTMKQFEAIWSRTGQSVLERVTETLALGSPEAAKLLAQAREPSAPAPEAAPALLKDAKQLPFFRANFALAYGKALAQRRIYEEALDSLRVAKVEQVVDPASYLFHRAVAEHALLLKDDANSSIGRLLDDVADAPERYKHLATLMHFDMLAWKSKDLGEIGRKMDNIERRLDLTRGGPQTQKLQKDVVARLDELIKQLENQEKGSGNCNGGACPNGGTPGQGGSNQPSSPQKDSFGGTNGGPGNIDNKRLENLAKAWGKLPEKERTAAMESLKRDLPPRYREAIESYFKKMAQGPSAR